MKQRLRLVLSAAACAGACVSPAPDDCVRRPGVVLVRAHDVRDRGVPISEAWIEQEGLRRACTVRFSTAECPLSGDGQASVSAIAGGEQLYGQQQVVRDEFCNLLAEPLSLVTEQLVCVPSDLEVVQGELFWSEDRPVADGDDVLIGAEVEGHSFLCSLEGRRFSCPALTRDAQLYQLRVQFGLSTLNQDVPVALEDCKVSAPVQARLVRSSWPCAVTTQQALRVFVAEADSRADTKRFNFLAEDAVHITDPRGQVSACVLEPPPTGYISRAFLCSAVTPAAGLYTVEVRHGTRVEQIETVIRDNGCEPVTDHLNLTLFPDHVCDYDTRCGPSGVRLRSFARCSVPVTGATGLPACEPSSGPEEFGASTARVTWSRSRRQKSRS